MADRKHLETYLAWHRTMLIDFKRMAAEEDRLPMAQRDANYADSVIRVEQVIADLEAQLKMLDSPNQTRTATGFPKTRGLRNSTQVSL